MMLSNPARLRLTSCHEIGIRGYWAVELVSESLLGFQPTLIRIPSLGHEELELTAALISEVRHLKEAAFGIRATSLSPSPYLEVTTVPTQRMHAIYWAGASGELPPQELLSSLLQQSGLSVAYLTNADWEKEQSIADPMVFRLLGGDESMAKLRPNARTGRLEVDLYRNPGRQSLLASGMWLQAAWRSWFGARAQHLLGRERLLSFKKANKVEELSGGLIFMELFERPEDSAEPESVARQQAFHDYFDLELQSAVCRLVYPSSASGRATGRVVELSPGRLRVEILRDEDGRIAGPERAVTRCVVICDELGRILDKTDKAA